MQVLHGLEGLSHVPRGAVASIGNFDGVHLGHQHILRTARKLADQTESRAQVVITFEPHPSTVLRPELAPPRLTPPILKEPLIEALGADYLVVLAPEPAVLNLAAEDFWILLRDQIQLSHVVEGSSFHFGKGAAGNVHTLRKWSAGSPVTLHIVDSVEVPLLDLRLVAVHSSLIRFLLDFGRVRDAAICLGRPYTLSGPIGHGAARGRTIGIRTANLQIDDQMLPTQGIYAGRCQIDGRLIPAAVSIGPAPTFDDPKPQVEAHLIDFDADLYGQRLDLQLLDWLRDIYKFPDVEALKRQIDVDIARSHDLADSDPARPIVPQVTLAGHTP
jgi:riboflavin kinase/FMN adenylyltransferase